MPRRSARRTLFLGWSSMFALALTLTASTVLAQEPSRNYTLLVASGFLCDPDHADVCPAVAKAASGETFELSGAGTFSPHDKSVTAAGAFTRKASSGLVLDTGVWLASALVSFDSYGVAPGVLQSAIPAFRAMHARPMMRTRMLVGPRAVGGLAVFRIRLLPLTGAPQNALLQVNCALGDVPRERSVEGIRLTLERNGTEFSEEVSGRVMFLTMRPEAIPPANSSQQDSTAETSEKPH